MVHEMWMYYKHSVIHFHKLKNILHHHYRNKIALLITLINLLGSNITMLRQMDLVLHFHASPFDFLKLSNDYPLYVTVSLRNTIVLVIMLRVPSILQVLTSHKLLK